MRTRGSAAAALRSSSGVSSVEPSSTTSSSKSGSVCWSTLSSAAVQEHGARVTIGYQQRFFSRVRLLLKEYPDVQGARCDVLKEEELTDFFARFAGDPIHVLVHSIAYGPPEAFMKNPSEVSALLVELKERGLIRQVRVVPESIYRFQHALTQEVAYDSLLQRQKKELHGRVGEAVEHVLGERLEDQYDILAGHFAESGAWAKAVHYGQLSARRSRGLSQFAEALTSLERTRS